MKPLTCLFALLLFLGGVHALHAEQRTLTVVADEWPPFSGEQLPNKGISLDVISTVLERAGYKVETLVLPWARIMNMAESQQIEIVGSLFFDPMLTDHLTYADSFFTTDVQLVQRIGDAHTYKSVKDLEPFSIAVGAGFLYQDEFDAADYLNKVEVTTTLQGMRMLAEGRVDLTLDSVDVVNHSFVHDDPDLTKKIEIAPGILASQDIHMAIGNSVQDRHKIIEDFNRVLAEMKADGSLDSLLAVHVQR